MNSKTIDIRAFASRDGVRERTLDRIAHGETGRKIARDLDISEGEVTIIIRAEIQAAFRRGIERGRASMRPNLPAVAA